MRHIRFSAIALLLACAFPTLASAAVKEIGVTYVKSPLNVPAIVEMKLGLFEKEFGPDGITVTHPDLNAGPKQTQAIAAGSVQFANCLGNTSALLAAVEGVDLKIIGIFSRAPEAFTIIAKAPGIASVRDLKGKKVVGPKGTLLHQLLIAALAKEGLKAADVEFLSMGLMEGVTAMLAGSADAALAAGAAVPKAQEQGARILATGKGLLDASTVIAVGGQFLKEHPDLVARFMKVHKGALAFMKENEREALRLTAEETGLTPEAVSAMYPLYDFDVTIRPSDIDDLRKTQEFLIENGMMEKRVDIDSLVVSIDAGNAK
jgi:sulfonate transport system substrate-binding protein